jgi:CheY-like chemotaxis protein
MQPTLHIFHADDDSDDRWLFQDGLSQCDPAISLTQFEDGAHLLKHLRTFPSEAGAAIAVICDMQMPLTGGEGVLRGVRQIIGWEHTPVIIFSTSSFLDDIRRCSNEGALAFFTKPGTYPEYLQVMRDMVSRCLEALSQPLLAR